MPEITADELSERLQTDSDPPFVVDVRNEDEFEDWHIPGSENAPVYGDLKDDPDAAKAALSDLPDDEEIVTVCAAGVLSQRATDRSTTMPVSVREAVLMGRFPHAGLGRIDGEDREIADRALERVGMAELADRPIGNLSGGQRQRAFIARALASEADLLALDEPTVGVDADSRTAFYNMLDELNGDGITIILIEHDVDILTEHVDSVACLNRKLYHHGDTVSFLESDAIAEAYGTTGKVIAHDHP